MEVLYCFCILIVVELIGGVIVFDLIEIFGVDVTAYLVNNVCLCLMVMIFLILCINFVLINLCFFFMMLNNFVCFL